MLNISGSSIFKSVSMKASSLWGAYFIQTHFFFFLLLTIIYNWITESDTATDQIQWVKMVFGKDATVREQSPHKSRSPRDSSANILWHEGPEWASEWLEKRDNNQKSATLETKQWYKARQLGGYVIKYLSPLRSSLDCTVIQSFESYKKPYLKCTIRGSHKGHPSPRANRKQHGKKKHSDVDLHMWWYGRYCSSPMFIIIWERFRSGAINDITTMWQLLPRLVIQIDVQYNIQTRLYCGLLDIFFACLGKEGGGGGFYLMAGV